MLFQEAHARQAKASNANEAPDIAGGKPEMSNEHDEDKWTEQDEKEWTEHEEEETEHEEEETEHEEDKRTSARALTVALLLFVGSMGICAYFAWTDYLSFRNAIYPWVGIWDYGSFFVMILTVFLSGLFAGLIILAYSKIRDAKQNAEIHGKTTT